MPTKKLTRDLTKAVTLRPREIYELYGILPSTVHAACTHPDPAKRLPSLKIPGRSGHRGIRLVDHAVLRAWLSKWETPRTGVGERDTASR